MKGLGQDIQTALDVVIEGLDFRFNVSEIESDKIKATMDSKLTSFNIAKELLSKWANSPNAPRKDKFDFYVESIISSGENSLNILRRALKAGINYEKLGESKHRLAIESKLSVLNAINNLEASVIELKHQHESGNVVLKTREFKRGFAEKYANQEFYPKKDYYKNVYNEEEEAIVIDPKGSKGDIIELDGLKIQLPHPPRDRSKILYSKLPKKEQYWRREPLPKGITPDNSEVYIDYIMEQFRMRREGVWFMNNGEPTFLTGRHWFQLQWGRMKDGNIYPDYRDAQKLIAYHKEACYIHNMCLGQIFLKSRQTGYTYGIISDSLEMATATQNIQNGLTSMTEGDAEKGFGKMTYMYQELPFFFQPIVKGRVDSPTKLEFGKPSDATKEFKKKKDTSTEGYLNTLLDYQATKEKAYDGQTLHLYVGDECLDPSELILCSNLEFKPIGDIKAGDFVINGEGKIKEVGRITSGETEMYKVIQPHGKDYIVSKNHRLLFEQGNSKSRTKDVIMTPDEYLSMSDYKKSITRRKVFNGVKGKKQKLLVNPYVFGAWLGDGFSNKPKFVFNHKKDKEILEYIKGYFINCGLDFILQEESDNWQKWYVSNIKIQHKNIFKSQLADLGVLGNKRIPDIYKESSRKQRLNLLAGIIDTDGTLNKKSKSSFTIGMSRKGLIEDIYNLSKSLGLDTSEITHSKSNFNTDVYRIRITDYNADIPCKVERKKPKLTPIKNRKGRIENIERLGIGKFVGITLIANIDKERTLVLKDYTLTLNSAKWDRASYIVHFNTLLPTMFRGGRVTGKCFLGSTMGKLSEGGEDFKALYLNSKAYERQDSGYTSTKLYSYFLPAHKNYEVCIDKYGKCWEETPPLETYNVYGDLITRGSVECIEQLYADAKNQGDTALNAIYRMYPMTEVHAMRDEAETCVFNLTKLTDQFDYNESQSEEMLYTRGTFEWKNDQRFSEVVWYPDDRGRFKVYWMPSDVDDTLSLRNNVNFERNMYFPMNNYGGIGVDCFGSYSIGKNKASKGAAHAVSKTNGYGVPSNKVLFEYIDKPATQDIFNEDILKAAWFYGLPILAENNRRDFVRYIYLNACRPFSMNRVDKHMKELHGDDLMLGGQPMQAKDILDSHENAIRTFIQRYVGFGTEPEYRKEGEMGTMPFNDTITDLMKFNPSSRTAHDATISLGLALMSIQKEKYLQKPKKSDPKKAVSLLRKYSNTGDIGTYIK